MICALLRPAPFILFINPMEIQMSQFTWDNKYSVGSEELDKAPRYFVWVIIANNISILNQSTMGMLMKNANTISGNYSL